MSSTIKFPTLENQHVEVKMEDAHYIRFESRTVALILKGEFKIEDYGSRRRFGGKAIKLALKYCKKIGEIKTSLPYFEFGTDEKLPRESENKCRAVNVDFIDEITEPGMGMVHELLAVSLFLRASRLSDLTCQYIFDHLAFKNYKKFREAFAFQFLFTPYFSRFEIQKIEHVLDGMLELPTLEKINSEFERTFPFSPKDLELAESENRSVRVGGNLEYKTNESSAGELFIKVEYIVRRMSSLYGLSMWLNDTTSDYSSQFNGYLLNLLNDPSADINSGKLHYKYSEHVSTFDRAITRCLFGQNIEREIANPCTNYEDIDAIADDIDDIELKMAKEVNEQKNEADKLTKILLAKWQNDHPHHKDKIFPHLMHFLENCYYQIYSVLCSVPGWISPNEVQHHFITSNICKKSAFEYADDPNEDQDEDGESEGPVSQISIADKLVRDDAVSSWTRLQESVKYEAPKFQVTYRKVLRLENDMRRLAHTKLLFKDEEILTFICKEKFMLYMRASEKGAGSKISFAEDKEEFNRIKIEIYEKFGGRGRKIEEAVEKYFQLHQKFHDAMVDETERQMKLHFQVEKRSKKHKRQLPG